MLKNKNTQDCRNRPAKVYYVNLCLFFSIYWNISYISDRYVNMPATEQQQQQHTCMITSSPTRSVFFGKSISFRFENHLYIIWKAAIEMFGAVNKSKNHFSIFHFVHCICPHCTFKWFVLNTFAIARSFFMHFYLIKKRPPLQFIGRFKNGHHSAAAKQRKTHKW